MSYMPKDLNDALEYMKLTLSYDQIEKLKDIDEKEFSLVAHTKSAAKLRKEWGLWGRETEISKWFIRNGIQQADDKSEILTTSLVRYLKDEPIRLDEQVDYYRDFWRDIWGKDPDNLTDYDVSDILRDC